MKGSKDAIRTARQLLKVTFVDGKLDGDRARSIVRRFAAEKPRGYLGILEAYYRMVRMETEKRHARVESATGLDAGLKDQVVKDLQSKYGDDLTTTFEENPELVGGMRVRVGSDVWDGSVRGRLAALAARFS